jgi:hypothetical protein
VTTVHSPYKDIKVAQRPGTVRNMIWKTAGPKKLFHRSQPKNMIEENIKAVNNDGMNFQKLTVHQKANLFNSNVERGDDYIIFKRKTLKPNHRRFNETRIGPRHHKRALSMIGVEKIKTQNPNTSKFKFHILKARKQWSSVL